MLVSGIRLYLFIVSLVGENILEIDLSNLCSINHSNSGLPKINYTQRGV